MDGTEEVKSTDEKIDLLDFSKIAKLPKIQQDLITTMSMSELQALRAVSHSYPNFLNSPLELREMIYKLLFTTEVSNTIVNVRHYKGRKKVGAKLPMNIILTSRQIHEEALTVLYRIRAGKFTYGCWEPGRRGKKPHFSRQAIHFRKLYLEIDPPKRLHQIEYAPSSGVQAKTLGHMLHCWATNLVTYIRNGHSLAKIEVEIKFPQAKSLINDALWFHAQSVHAVRTMKKDLGRRLPDPGTVVISQIDRETILHCFQPKRMNANMVRCSYGTAEYFLKLQDGRIVEEESV